MAVARSAPHPRCRATLCTSLVLCHSTLHWGSCLHLNSTPEAEPLAQRTAHLTMLPGPQRLLCSETNGGA